MTRAEDFTVLAISVTIIGLRVYVRWTQVGFAHWQVDDFLMPVIGAVFGIATTIAYIVMVKLRGLTNSHLSDELRATLSPETQEYVYRQAGSKAQVFLWSVYAFMLWALKVCVAVFYSRLTERLTNLRTRVRFAYVLLGTTYVAVALTMLLSCQPMSKFWQINPDPGNSCQPAISKVYVFVVLIPNILTDVYLLSIPLPLLWKANITWQRKAILITLFSGAVFSMITGVIRADVILRGGTNVVYDGSAWACRETFVAIAVTNIPILHPLFKRGAEKLGLTIAGRFSRTTATTASKRSYPLSTLSHRRTHPATNAWGSDERILTTDAPTTTTTAGVNDNNHHRRTESAAGRPSGGIIVDQEIRVTIEPAPTARRWGHGSASDGEWDSAPCGRPVAPRSSTRSVRIGSAARA
ncbi:hypothetical protein F4677DRAFT_444503 [Hypoxylon crocopeplum]|nr:hypothetical protein F4677DRAFT_444503 [Hypoxylon crocopeplum]